MRSPRRIACDGRRVTRQLAGTAGSRRSGREFAAALTATGGQDGTTRASPHAQTEAVRLGTTPVVRLEGPLAHGVSITPGSSTTPRGGPPADRPDLSQAARAVREPPGGPARLRRQRARTHNGTDVTRARSNRRDARQVRKNRGGYGARTPMPRRHAEPRRRERLFHIGQHCERGARAVRLSARTRCADDPGEPLEDGSAGCRASSSNTMCPHLVDGGVDESTGGGRRGIAPQPARPPRTGRDSADTARECISSGGRSLRAFRRLDPGDHPAR
jgi:hypothetical protein